MTYLIDLSKVSDKAQMHDAICDILEFPAYYGKNLDALWDCLTGDLQTPCSVRLILSSNTPYADALCELFHRAQTWHTRRGHQMTLTIEHI